MLMDQFKSKGGIYADASQCTSVMPCLSFGLVFNNCGYFSIVLMHALFWSQKVQFKRWAQKLDAIFQKYRFAMSKLSKKYVKDYWFWETTVLNERWEERQRPASGYQVLSVVDVWNGEDELVIAKDIQTLQREFLVSILASNLNEAREVLPDDVKSWPTQIVGKQE